VHLDALAPLKDGDSIAVVRVVRMTEQESFLANDVAASFKSDETGQKNDDGDRYTETNLFECVHII